MDFREMEEKIYNEHLRDQQNIWFQGTMNQKILDALRAAYSQGVEDAAKKAFSLSSPLESKSAVVEAKRNTADAIGQMILALKPPSEKI